MSANTQRSVGRPPILSHDIVVETALGLATADPTTTLTMARIGAELGTDPSAVYRYFKNRDELVLAVADMVYLEALDQVPAGLAWDDELLVAIRGAFIRRPALALETVYRFLGGPGEAQVIARSLELVRSAGFAEDEAELHVRLLGEYVLGNVMSDSGWLTLDEQGRKREREVEHRIYTSTRNILDAHTSVEDVIREDVLVVNFIKMYLAGATSTLTGRS